MNGKMLDITHILKIEKQILYKFTEPSPISEYSNIRKIRMLNDHWYRIIQCGLLMAAHKIKLLTSDLIRFKIKAKNTNQNNRPFV